jgi:hypothetical protein
MATNDSLLSHLPNSSPLFHLTDAVVRSIRPGPNGEPHQGEAMPLPPVALAMVRALHPVFVALRDQGAR